MKTSKLNTQNYTIERVREIDPQLCRFLIGQMDEAQKLFPLFDVSNFDFYNYAAKNLMLVCRRRGEPVGVVLAQLYGSVFDPKTKVLFQDLLLVKKSSGKAAYLLMQEFIAFGRAHSNLVFTMTLKHTNIKGRTLERLGFEKAEELYRLEV